MDIPETMALGVVGVFMSHLREELAPFSPREWGIDADFAYRSLIALTAVDTFSNGSGVAAQADQILVGVPGIIKWSEYIYDIHIDCASSFGMDRLRLWTLIRLFSAVAADHALAPALLEVPGGLELLTKLWIWEGGVDVASSHVLLSILQHSVTSGKKDSLERIIRTADGNPCNVAALALRRTKKASKGLHSVDTDEALPCLTTHINLLFTLCRLSHNPLRQAFYDEGLIKTVTRSFAGASRAIPQITQLTRRCLTCDQSGLSARLARLESGISSNDTTHCGCGVGYRAHIIPPYLVYRSLVEVVSSMAEKLETPHYAELLAQPTVKAAFTPFFLMLDKRLPALLEEKEVANRKCRYSECGRVDAEMTFKRCKGCQTAHYCSPECQKLDWKPTHRELCHLFRTNPAGHHAQRDLDSLGVFARRTVATAMDVFREIVEREFPDTASDELIPCIDFERFPERYSVKTFEDAIISDLHAQSMLEKFRTWGVTPLGCWRRNGSRVEMCRFALGKKNFFVDERARGFQESLGQLSIEDDGH
ncbi:hypothetical protein FB45DRAFT_1029398 [Roridomyces roridus]|uniref:MYND-type domain-containing protein n=1 Tax=Roridomyces roridus TaxID=1738132 RepID=A0AAD7FLT7_9AGAR|nr:hypothetical protein FB45DRAFT_1029398 [Roridomyces roridus]